MKTGVFGYVNDPKGLVHVCYERLVTTYGEVFYTSACGNIFRVVDPVPSYPTCIGCAAMVFGAQCSVAGAWPATTDYCKRCGESPQSGSHVFDHPCEDP
jgi:hypothetical protein